MATEALFLTCLINVMEYKEVATVDIPGAFIQADMEGETVNMKLEGKMADLLMKINPKLYRKYTTKKIVGWSSTCSLSKLYTVLSKPYFFSGET